MPQAAKTAKPATKKTATTKSTAGANVSLADAIAAARTQFGVGPSSRVGR